MNRKHEACRSPKTPEKNWPCVWTQMLSSPVSHIWCLEETGYPEVGPGGLQSLIREQLIQASYTVLRETALKFLAMCST